MATIFPLYQSYWSRGVPWTPNTHLNYTEEKIVCKLTFAYFIKTA